MHGQGNQPSMAFKTPSGRGESPGSNNGRHLELSAHSEWQRDQQEMGMGLSQIDIPTDRRN